MSTLVIKNLHASVEGKKILKGVNLSIRSGQVHALMGPNGSGKSTLASIIMGHPKYTITRGTITFKGKNVKSLTPEERATLGIFLSFQYPVEVPGLSLEHFLRSAYNSLHPQQTLSAVAFHQRYQEKMAFLKMKKEFGERSLNEGFSGGEKKKSEILQLAVLEPSMAILDETDSGLDIDALRTVAGGVSKIAAAQKNLGVLLITHYFRILRYIKPDRVHIMVDGRIIKSGDKRLATQVEKRGYDWLIKK
jgi:Fe-S cluster assembly ATP-binding protein